MERVLAAFKNHSLTGKEIQHLVTTILEGDAIYLSTLPKRLTGGPEFIFARSRTLRADVAFVRRVLKHFGKRLTSVRHSVRHRDKVATVFTYQSINIPSVVS